MSELHRTLPGHYYTSPAQYEKERERLFARGWVWAGREEVIPSPGDFFRRTIAGESILLTRDAGHQLRAFFNVCRHRGTQMCTLEAGRLPGRVQCPYHGWSYGLDGRLLGAPHMEQPGFRLQDYPLHEAGIGSWDGHLFVQLQAGGLSLEAHLGALPAKFAHWGMQDLRLHQRIVYDVQANWKLLVSNYNECLHCPLLHPALNKLTDYLGADNEPPAATYIGGAMGFRGGAETMSLDGKRRRAYLPRLEEHERKLVSYYAIYPNLLLSLHPDYMMVHSLWPQAVDRTQVICEWYFDPEEMRTPGFVADDVIAFWDQTNREDWRISELSQAGIASRAYTPGPYSPRESLLQAFDEYIRRNTA